MVAHAELETARLREQDHVPGETLEDARRRLRGRLDQAASDLLAAADAAVELGEKRIRELESAEDWDAFESVRSDLLRDRRRDLLEPEDRKVREIKRTGFDLMRAEDPTVIAALEELIPTETGQKRKDDETFLAYLRETRQTDLVARIVLEGELFRDEQARAAVGVLDDIESYWHARITFERLAAKCGIPDDERDAFADDLRSRTGIEIRRGRKRD